LFWNSLILQGFFVSECGYQMVFSGRVAGLDGWADITWGRGSGC